MFSEVATYIVIIFIAVWAALTASLFKTAVDYDEFMMTAIRLKAAHYDEQNKFIFDGCQK